MAATIQLNKRKKYFCKERQKSCTTLVTFTDNSSMQKSLLSLFMQFSFSHSFRSTMKENGREMRCGSGGNFEQSIMLPFVPFLFANDSNLL